MEKKPYQISMFLVPFPPFSSLSNQSSSSSRLTPGFRETGKVKKNGFGAGEAKRKAQVGTAAQIVLTSSEGHCWKMSVGADDRKVL